MKTRTPEQIAAAEMRIVEREERKLEVIKQRVAEKRRKAEEKANREVDKIERKLAAIKKTIGRRSTKRRTKRAGTHHKGEARKLYLSSVDTFIAQGFSPPEARVKATLRLKRIHEHEAKAHEFGSARPKPKKKTRKKAPKKKAAKKSSKKKSKRK